MHTMAHEMGNKVDTVTILLAGSQGGGRGGGHATDWFIESTTQGRPSAQTARVVVWIAGS